MRVLMVTPMLPDAGGRSAGEIVFFGQIRALAARHSVTLASFAADADTNRCALEALRAVGVHCRTVQAPGPSGYLPIWLLHRLLRWTTGKDPLRALWFRDPSMQRLIDAVLAEQVFDAILLADNAMAAYHYPEDLPVILTETDVRYPAPPRDWNELGPFRRVRLITAFCDGVEQRKWIAYQLRCWRRATRIQVFTPRDAAKALTLDRTLEQKLEINPFGYDLPTLMDSDRPERQGLIVFIGTFAHRPNVDAALWLGDQIMPLLRQMAPGVRLKIVGADPPERVRALGQCTDIEIAGYVPELRACLAEAEVAVAPIRTGGGMRQKVLEAMAWGKPVVTTPLGADGLEFAGVAPPVRIADTAWDFAAATASLLHSRSERELLGSQARAFVTQYYTWDSYSDRLERALSGVQHRGCAVV
jgi:glycosyltransferase involved in cell wall biosynthesis